MQEERNRNGGRLSHSHEIWPNCFDLRKSSQACSHSPSNVGMDEVANSLLMGELRRHGYQTPDGLNFLKDGGAQKEKS
jgi:hypothetical protein